MRARIRAPRACGSLDALENQDAGAVAHHETVAIDVERPRCSRNVAVTRERAGAHETFVHERDSSSVSLPPAIAASISPRSIIPEARPIASSDDAHAVLMASCGPCSFQCIAINALAMFGMTSAMSLGVTLRRIVEKTRLRFRDERKAAHRIADDDGGSFALEDRVRRASSASCVATIAYCVKRSVFRRALRGSELCVEKVVGDGRPERVSGEPRTVRHRRDRALPFEQLLPERLGCAADRRNDSHLP